MAEMKKIDAYAIEKLGIPSLTLMDTAASEMAKEVIMPDGIHRKGRALVVCGSGNNGGDGFAAAWHLFRRDIDIRLVFVGDEAHMTPDCHRMMERYIKDCDPEKKTFLPLASASFSGVDAIVDAIFGIGIDRPVEGIYREAIELINASAAPVIACDIPSGLNGDTGEIMGICVKAEKTVTFTCGKPGLFMKDGPEAAGSVIVKDIGIPLDKVIPGIKAADKENE